MDNKTKKESLSRGIASYIVHLLLTSIILTLTSFLTPGFSIKGITPMLIAAIVITSIDYLIESFMGIDASPFGKGIKGFLVAALILYLTQFIVPNMRVSIMGSIIASVVIGLLDAILPGRTL